MMTRKLAYGFCLLLLVSSGLFLSSCTDKHSQREETITLIWWGDIYNRAFGQKITNTYNAKNPRVKVKLLPVEQAGGQYHSKILSMNAAGIPPDIVLLSSGQHLDYASKGIFLSLDKYETDPEFETLRRNMWENALGSCKYNGTLFFIPIWTNPIGIFYNKTLFDKAGVPYPTSDWDFDEFLDKAKRLTFDFNDDGRVDQFGFGGISLSVTGWDLYMLIEAFGGHLYSEDGRRCLINTPESISAVQWAIDLSKKYHVCPTIQEERSGGSIVSASGADYFRSGKIAMILSGRWYLDTLRKVKDLRWGIAPFPMGEKRVMFQRSNFLSISSKTRYPDECWKFLKFAIGEEGQALISQERSDIPVLKSMAYSQDFLNYDGRPDANKVFLNMLEYAKVQQFVIGKTKWIEFARDRFELVVLGKLTVRNACDEIATEFLKD